MLWWNWGWGVRLALFDFHVVMELPIEPNIDVSRLAVIFNDTTNSYKFYWFLAILDTLSEGASERLDVDDLAMRMVADVWFPLNYYKLSFGKQDGFKKVADYISAHMTIDPSPRASALEIQINQNLGRAEIQVIKSKVGELLRWVPYRFLRPFFMVELRGLTDTKVNGAVIQFCNDNFERDSRRVMYKFEGRSIILNRNWLDYFKTHHQILRGFTYWHLVKFLQKNNPNVPGLSSKIFKPDVSNRNLSDATKFWKYFLLKTPDCHCIYSGQPITQENFSLDHFLPWSFVVHNHFWNLIPVPKNVNSSKSDWLPDLRYFPQFAQQQYEIFKFYFQLGKKKALEDYFVNVIPNEHLASQEEFIQRLERQIFPQYQIAKNMGFPSPFIFNDKQKSI
jgi:hypothetical protein